MPAGPRRRRTASTRPWRAATVWRLLFCSRGFSPSRIRKRFAQIFVLSNVPRRAAPRFPAPFALCAAVCAFKGWGGVCTRQSPLKRVLRRLWAMCEKSVWIRLRRWRNEPLGRVFFLLTMPCSRGFRPLFTRSIVELDKERCPCAGPSQPQSPAVRGFFEGSARCTFGAYLQGLGEPYRRKCRRSKGLRLLRKERRTDE